MISNDYSPTIAGESVTLQVLAKDRFENLVEDGLDEFSGKMTSYSNSSLIFEDLEFQYDS